MQNGYWQDVRKHQINSSSSKHTFGFPKEKRFRSTSKTLCDSFYNIPSSIGKSPKTGIGLGKKIDFIKKNQSPSPNKYHISSDFNLHKKNLPMGKFSLGRDKIKHNGIFVSNNNPAPGNYQLRKSMILQNSTSMHSKLPSLKKSFQLNPGPGHYTLVPTLNKNGHQILSTIVNTPGLKIKPSKQYDPQKYRVAPGPGAYNTQKENLNKTGSFFNSRYSNSRCRSFSKSPKNENEKTQRQAPGPGAYKFFSDFGTNKTKYPLK